MHRNGECFSGDPSMSKEDCCLDCAWYKILNFNRTQMVVSLQLDDYQRSLREMRMWLRSQPARDRGEISSKSLWNMLHGLRFGRLRVTHVNDPQAGKLVEAVLLHEGGHSYVGRSVDISDAIGKAVSSYIANLVMPEARSA